MLNIAQYAFYGSLRKGMYNYDRYSQHLEYLGTTQISGYQLYLLENYPFAIRSNDPKDEIIIELFAITNPQTERDIYDLEIGADYFLDVINVNGKPTGIYLFNESFNHIRINHGDWVKYFEEHLKSK